MTTILCLPNLVELIATPSPPHCIEPDPLWIVRKLLVRSSLLKLGAVGWRDLHRRSPKLKSGDL
jgi:hypothetical protein